MSAEKSQISFCQFKGGIFSTRWVLNRCCFLDQDYRYKSATSLITMLGCNRFAYRISSPGSLRARQWVFLFVSAMDRKIKDSVCFWTKFCMLTLYRNIILIWPEISNSPEIYKYWIYIPSIWVVVFCVAEYSVSLGEGSQSSSQIQWNWRGSAQCSERIVLLPCGLAVPGKAPWSEAAWTWGGHERHFRGSHNHVPGKVNSLLLSRKLRIRNYTNYI